MFGQWEVVGKKKDRTSKLPVPKVNNEKEKNKKNTLNGIKIEEVLPKSQVQNIYSKSTNKEDKKSGDKVKSQDVTKKPQKKEKVVQQPQKFKSPKSIEGALNMIDVEEFQSIYEKSKAHFPDTPIVSLKDLVQFLNQKLSLEVQDPVFSSKPEGYPLTVLPSGIKLLIEKAVKEAGKDNAQLFFDICLTSLATDMGKGLPGLGYRFFLQYIASNHSKLVCTNVNKHIILKNSYQNRPNIGLSILWAVGHVGINDPQSGLTVFQELFLPLIDMKHYSPYVSSYLLNLIRHPQLTSLNREQFFLILDTAHSNKKNISQDLQEDLVNKAENLKPLLFKNSKEKYHTYVDLLLRKITNSNNKPYQNSLCDILLDVFQKDQTTLGNWNKVYSKNLTGSAILLKYIDDNWNIASKKLNKGTLKELLIGFDAVNKELSVKKRTEDGLKDSIAAIKRINEKMVVKTSGSSFRIFFIILMSVVGLIYYDIKTNGSWQDSKTHTVLKDAGVCEYTNVFVAKVKEGIYWVDAQIEENFPGYHKTVADFSNPYLQLATDIGKVAGNICKNIKDVAVEKYPLLIQSIESYAPGLLEQSQNIVSNAYTTSVFYFNRSVDYLKTEVFVGQLSPENVQRVVIGALNTTQQKATEYYHWIYEKVQTTIK